MLALFSIILVVLIVANVVVWFETTRYASDGISKVLATAGGVLTVLILAFVLYTIITMPTRTPLPSAVKRGPALLA